MKTLTQIWSVIWALVIAATELAIGILSSWLSVAALALVMSVPVYLFVWLAGKYYGIDIPFVAVFALSYAVRMLSWRSSNKE